MGHRQPDICSSPLLSGLHHSLSMPLIDLLDVSKHNPVTASKTLRDPLTSHGGHVTLWEGLSGRKDVWGQPCGNPLSPRNPDVRRRGGGTGKVGQRNIIRAFLKISPGQRERAGPELEKIKGATSTICPKSSTYIFSVSTSSPRTYLGRKQECTFLV